MPTSNDRKVSSIYIELVANGYIVSRRVDASHLGDNETHCFETFDGLVKYLKQTIGEVVVAAS